MSQLIEINGKYYQEAEVVMLATDKRSNLQLNVIHKILFSDKEGAEIPSQPFKHLYVVFNEEIKEGDWFIDLKDNTIWQNKAKESMRKSIFPECKKIIATTDESLHPNASSNYTRENGVEGLARPSDSFIRKYIEEYNKGSQITKVLVEYEFNQHKFMATLCTTKEKEYNLKVDSGNCITIKKIEPKLYTHEQLENHIRNAMQFKGYTPEYEVQEYCKKYLN